MFYHMIHPKDSAINEIRMEKLKVKKSQKLFCSFKQNLSMRVSFDFLVVKFTCRKKIAEIKRDGAERDASAFD